MPSINKAVQFGINKTSETAIVLLNMGGPSDLNEVKPFLTELFSDPVIIDLPIFLKPFQRLIAIIIAKFRSDNTKNMYGMIGGGSPILNITHDFGQKLHEKLQIPVFVVMRYTEPRSKKVVQILSEKGIKRVILFSQYPFYSRSTSLSSINDFRRNLNFEVKLDYIDNWGSIDPHIAFWIRSIEREIRKLDSQSIKYENIHILFSAHGLPVKYVNKGDKYPIHVKIVADKIETLLRNKGYNANFHLSYQSKVGPVEWLKPYTNDTIKDLSGGEALIMVPLGFVSDHVETLYEIDIEYRNLAKEVGIKYFRRAAVPNADPDYVAAIAAYMTSEVL